MKINSNHKIIGEKVVLIPYKSKHVKKYHNWMKNPELQHLTASEPLSLEQEFDMQKSWSEDEDKCTFLILSKELYNQSGDEIESLIGDTNLFMQNDEEKIAECEIMIAESSFRGQRFGWEAMLLMLKYGQDKLNIDKFIVKISESNEKSINMFKKMQFNEISKSSVFQEITLERKVDSDWISWLDQQVILDIKNYVQ